MAFTIRTTPLSADAYIAQRYNLIKYVEEGGSVSLSAIFPITVATVFTKFISEEK